MCGLVGIYSSNMLQKHEETLGLLLYFDTLRGRDSTGVSAIRSNSDTSTIKATVPGTEFIEGYRLESHLKYNDFCWIGHNRAGTVGKNSRANAHPFEVIDEKGDCYLVGAHNGTLKNRHVLNNYLDFGTDSEALFNHINDTSLEETIPIIEGAWALTYYDHLEEELRFLRNDERTLFYAFEEDGKTLIWASEQWMIRVACMKSGIKLKGDKVHSFAVDTLYKFPRPSRMGEVLTHSRKGGFVGKKAEPHFFNHNGKKREWKNGGWKDIEEKEEKKTGTVRDILTAKEYKGFGGVPLSKAELEEQLSGGCSWCEVSFIQEGDRFAWLDHGKPICSHCLEDSHKEEEAKPLAAILVN